MACCHHFTDVFVCVLWIAQINQYFCEDLSQNVQFSKLTTSSSQQPYLIKAVQTKHLVTPQSCHATLRDDYAITVRKSLRRNRKDNLNASTLQELIVRGFQRLCFWTGRVKEKFKMHSQLRSDDHQSVSLADTFVTSTKYGQFQFNNITIVHFPSLDEKTVVNPLSANCTGVFKTTYQAKSNQTTMKGEMLANGTRIAFILIYENTTILLNDTKTLQKNGSILSTRVSVEYNFDNFVAQTSNNQDVEELLDLVTPALLRQFIAQDPSGRITYASMEQDVKIDEFKKRDVVRLMAHVLGHYLRSQYKKPYQISVTSDHVNCLLPDTIEYVQMDGLDRCKVYGSNVHLSRRGDNLVMKLAFSINFLDDEKENDTTLTIRERKAVSQKKPVIVKKILIKLELSSPFELDKPSNLRFYLNAVKAEIVAKHQPTWFQSIKSKLNAFFGEILTQVVLSWILYETN